MSATTEKIRSRGHWDIVIRPESFTADLVPYEDLDAILERVVVRFRGWPVPFIDSRLPLQRGDDWIGQDIDARLVSHFEAWRFFTSGQFNHLRAVSADWREGREATSVPAGYAAVVEVWEILFYLTEVFELAARLALSPAGDDPMRIEATLNGLTDRGLVVGQRNRASFIEPYRASVPSMTRTRTLRREQLIADPKREALAMALEFFVRFGWKPRIDQLAQYQLELTDVP